jgi:hypothetical protein
MAAVGKQNDNLHGYTELAAEIAEGKARIAEMAAERLANGRYIEYLGLSLPKTVFDSFNSSLETFPTPLLVMFSRCLGVDT